MHKDVKKLIKFLLIISAVLGTAYFVFIMWVAMKIVSPAQMTNLENRAEEVKNLLFCEEKLEQRKDSKNYYYYTSYEYYLSKKECPPEEKLHNVKEIQKEFCDRALKEDPRLHNIYVNRDKICPNSNNSPTQ